MEGTQRHKGTLNLPPGTERPSVSWVGQTLCLGYRSGDYVLIHDVSGFTNFVDAIKFPVPRILLLGPGEVLLAHGISKSSECLGVYLNIDANGDAKGNPVFDIAPKSTISWPQEPISMCLSHPYIISLVERARGDPIIEIHSNIDQQRLQTIPLPHGTILESPSYAFDADLRTEEDSRHPGPGLIAASSYPARLCVISSVAPN